MQESTEEKIAELQRKVSRNSVAIYGNGKEGLLTRISILESNSNTTKDHLKMAISISSVAVAIVALIIAMITAN